MTLHCRNQRCRDWLDDPALIGFCPSCRLMLRYGVSVGVGVCTVVGFALGVLDWLVRQ